MAPLKIHLAPATPSDYLSLARLMAAAFAHEEYGVVAFGPERNSDAAIEASAKRLAQPPQAGETLCYMKAVTTLPDDELPGGREEIVGFASWSTVIGRTGSEEEKGRLGTKEAWAQEEKEKAEKAARGEKEDEDQGTPPGGNARLREDSLGKGDVIMARSTEGRDYSKLAILVVAPNYQRQGIGKMLFEDGLKRADESGLQVVLGASEQGLGLYRRYGCVDVAVMDLKLWEYEGGEGLGLTRWVYMRRAPVKRED